MIQNLFHSEQYRQLTYTIMYVGREGYNTTVYLTKDKAEERNFTKWKNAERWARSTIDETVRRIVPFR